MQTFDAPVSERLTRRIADATDRDACELPPLYEAIDPEALDSAIETMSNGEVSFDYVGYEVTINSNGEISLTAK